MLVREPGGTGAAEQIRALVADPAVELTPLAELHLFCAARADLAERVIAPALEDGREVVADRFADSSAAYQGGGRGLGIELAEQLSRSATRGLEPDLTLLLRIDPQLAAERRGGSDRFEAEGLELQRAVADAYEKLAARHPERIVAVDAGGTVDEVRQRVMAIVRERRP